MQPFEDFVGEPCADMADVAPAIAFTQGERQGPKNGRVRRGAVKPTMTTSCRFDVLIFSQASVRAPETLVENGFAANAINTQKKMTIAINVAMT